MAAEDAAAFIEHLLGHSPADPGLFETALTHGSHDSTNTGGEDYQRLEFLGDRVLGLVIARWLYERFPAEAEGKIARRYNALVARETCAEVGRAIDLPKHIRLGRQARDDKAQESENVIGDVIEAMLGALYLDAGLEECDDFVRAHWQHWLEGQAKAPVHPKSGLQELAAKRQLGVVDYELKGTRGPPHKPRFTVVARVRGAEAQADGSSKQEAETAAAKALLERLQ